MKKGVGLRLDVHKILYNIYRFNKILESNNIKKIIIKHKKIDIAFIYNVCMGTMRYNFHVGNVIKKYVDKKPKVKEYILLKSAITQIVFLNFKDYAVIDSTVEVAKKLKIHHGFINACLKKIAKDKKELKDINIKFDNLPYWFRDKTKNLNSYERKTLLENFFDKPSLHIVFKNKKNFLNFEYDLISTSSKSGFLKEEIRINKLKSLKYGLCWIQDFSSFFPINNINIKNIKEKNIDLCAAPGGKSFQILSLNKNIIMNDKSKNRIELIKENLDRLKFKTEIFNYDVLKLESKEKYDFIILDAPCSALGTIRKNPEIFFKKKGPEFDYLCNLQSKMLEKSVNLLSENGSILYMVCSFIDCESTNQISKFLSKNKNFYLEKFITKKDDNDYNSMIKNGMMFTLPSKYMGFNIDGYFAAHLKMKV